MFSTFLGGIPSGHSVLDVPLNLSVMSLIFTGCKIRRNKHPRRMAGGLDWYSAFSNPSKNRCGSAKMMYSFTDFDSACGCLGNFTYGCVDNSSRGNTGELSRSSIVCMVGVQTEE